MGLEVDVPVLKKFLFYVPLHVGLLFCGFIGFHASIFYFALAIANFKRFNDVSFALGVAIALVDVGFSGAFLGGCYKKSYKMMRVCYLYGVIRIWLNTVPYIIGMVMALWMQPEGIFRVFYNSGHNGTPTILLLILQTYFLIALRSQLLHMSEEQRENEENNDNLKNTEASSPAQDPELPDIPTFKRFLFIFPLRRGLMTWGIFYLIASVIYLILVILFLIPPRESIINNYQYSDDLHQQWIPYLCRVIPRIVTILSYFIMYPTNIYFTYMFLVGHRHRNLNKLNKYLKYGKLKIIFYTSAVFVIQMIYNMAGPDIRRFMYFDDGSEELVIFQPDLAAADILIYSYFLLVVYGEIKKLEKQLNAAGDHLRDNMAWALNDSQLKLDLEKEAANV